MSKWDAKRVSEQRKEGFSARITRACTLIDEAIETNILSTGPFTVRLGRELINNEASHIEAEYRSKELVVKAEASGIVTLSSPSFSSNKEKDAPLYIPPAELAFL